MPSDFTQSVPLNTSYYVDGGGSIKARIEEIWKENSSQWLQMMYEGDIDTRMYSGDSEAMYTYIAQTYGYTKRNLVSFNKLRRLVNMISGYQRRNRKSSVIVPQESQDQLAADQLSNVLMWAMQRSEGYHCISNAFQNCLITGINLISVWLDYNSDPVNGDIRCNVNAYNGFLMDPFFKSLDLNQDCNYVWTRKWITKDQAKILLPGREKEIDAMNYSTSRDAKFPYQPENLNYQQKGLLPYDEFWYKDTRKQEMLLDRQTGETYKWSGEDENLNRFLASYPQVTKITQTIPTVRYAVVMNDREMVNGPNPYNIDKYPFVPAVCYFHPEIPYCSQRIQGIVRGQRDAQWSYDRRMRLSMDYLEAGISRGVKYVEDALVDPEDAFMRDAGRALAIKKGHSLDEVQELQGPNLPPSWFEIINLLGKEMPENVGITEELLGMDEGDQKAGILNMLRQGAGLTTLQPILDKIDHSQKLLAQLYIDLMQNNWEVGKYQRILNEEPHPIIANKYFSKFDIQVIDGALTPTQQILEFQQLKEMMEAGILPNSPEVFELLVKTAPLQNKKDLIEAVQKQQQQQAQMQQQQAELAMQELQAKTNLANARAEADTGLGIERVSRVEENRAMAIANMEEAKKDQDLAELHKAKALKELTEMDLNQVERALGLLQLIQQSQSSKKEPEEQLSEKTIV